MYWKSALKLKQCSPNLMPWNCETVSQLNILHNFKELKLKVFMFNSDMSALNLWGNGTYIGSKNIVFIFLNCLFLIGETFSCILFPKHHWTPKSLIFFYFVINIFFVTCQPLFLFADFIPMRRENGFYYTQYALSSDHFNTLCKPCTLLVA